jgi:hypothetical protein
LAPTSGAAGLTPKLLLGTADFDSMSLRSINGPPNSVLPVRSERRLTTRSASIEPPSGVASHGERLRTSPRRMYRKLYALAVSADLTEPQLRRCRRALRRFWVKEVARTGRSRASDLRHRVVRP